MESLSFIDNFSYWLSCSWRYKFSKEFENLVLDLVKDIKDGKIKALDLQKPDLIKFEYKRVHSIWYKGVEIWICNFPYGFLTSYSKNIRTSWKTMNLCYNALKLIFDVSEKDEFSFKEEDEIAYNQKYLDLTFDVEENKAILYKQIPFSNEWLESYIKYNHSLKDLRHFIHSRWVYRDDFKSMRCGYCHSISHDESEYSCPERTKDASRFVALGESNCPKKSGA